MCKEKCRSKPFNGWYQCKFHPLTQIRRSIDALLTKSSTDRFTDDIRTSETPEEKIDFFVSQSLLNLKANMLSNFHRCHTPPVTHPLSECQHIRNNAFHSFTFFRRKLLFLYTPFTLRIQVHQEMLNMRVFADSLAPLPKKYFYRIFLPTDRVRVFFVPAECKE